MESTTFLLRDEKGRDYAIFAGDTLFLGDVGRPDLATKQGEITKENLAALLFDSLRKKIMPLPSEVIVYPGHGAGSACGKNLSSETWGYLGDQKKFNYALRADMTKKEFVKEVTAGLTPPPQYFFKNAMINKSGYQSFDEVMEKGAIALDPAEFEEVAEQHDALILDVRPSEEYAKEHIPNAIFIGLDGSFAPWVGALVTDIQQAIVIVAPEGREEETVMRLARVGYDNTLGCLKGGMDAWKKAGKGVGKIKSIPAAKFEERHKAGKVEAVLDVRKPSEFLSQHITDAQNFPLDYINNNMHKLNRYNTYYLHCRSGYRSMVAASILKARGFDSVFDLAGGWIDIEQTGVPKTDLVCPTTIPQEVVDKAVEAVV